MDFNEISKTEIFVYPRLSKLSTSLLSPAPISIICESRFKFKLQIKSSESFGDF